ncbi:MAG: OmpA family protein [Epsilonproteobacteria bacterium]|nr:OmpA family protein [Campylobacterota bacterium]
MKIYINIALLSLLFLSGCSQKPLQGERLKAAKTAYLKLKEDPQINNDAPMELYSAGKVYAMSESVKSVKEADHLAFMLEGQVEVVKESARAKKLTQDLQKLKALKTQALLDEKESQLLILQKEAQKARLEAQMTQEKLEALQELNAKQTNRGLVLTLGDVLFETGKSKLLAGSLRAIEKLTVFLRDNPERLVLIEGHTDNVGSATFNLDLSLRRAGAVEEALIAKGIVSNRMSVKGYGEIYPVASNNESAGRQRNRRVEIVILEEGANPEEMLREIQN